MSKQGVRTENPHIISYGAEGYKWPKNELYLVFSKVVDAGTVDGQSLMPDSEYAHPHNAVQIKGQARRLGALQSSR